MEGQQNACYSCQYRLAVPGSCHSACVHPKVREIMSDPMSILKLFAGQDVGMIDTKALAEGENAIEIVGESHGIRNNWFLWPINFDPVWLVKCTGFSPIGKEENNAGQPVP